MKIAFEEIKNMVDKIAVEDHIPSNNSAICIDGQYRMKLFGRVRDTSDSTDIQPSGLLPLEEECILEATFNCFCYYDSFEVIDSAPLKCAIEKLYPWAAMKMKESLHMTVSYPGNRKVPGLSKEYDNVFKNVRDFPVVRLYIREIYVSNYKEFGSAVVAAVDSAIMFDFNNNGTPAHLTLWGHPPVRAGRMLIGKPITLRNPFITVTDERVVASMAAKVKELEKLRNSLNSTEGDLCKLLRHCTFLERLLVRRVTRVQSYVRRWLVQLHFARLRRLRQLTPRQRAVLTAFVNKWTKLRLSRIYQYDSDYDDDDDQYWKDNYLKLLRPKINHLSPAGRLRVWKVIK